MASATGGEQPRSSSPSCEDLKKKPKTGEEEGKGELPNGQSLEDIVSPLAEICTYESLDRARRRKYGDDYGVWPEQWSNRGEELLALDRAGHVPNDTPETTFVRDLVFSFVQRLAQLLPKEIGTHEIKVIPIGSFPIDCRVGGIDEFDFLLVGAVFWEGDIIRLTLDPTSPPPLERSDGVRVTAVYEHGPAVCVELGWTCGRGHEHSLSIDMTEAWEVSDLSQVQYLQTSDKTGEGPFTEWVRPPFDQLVDMISSEHPKSPNTVLDIFPMDTNITSAEYDAGANAITSAVYDILLMDIVRDVSENILAAYRLLKLLCGHLLPRWVDVNNDTKECRTPCIVSSHKLKCLVYHHVMRHPTGEAWSVDQVPVRLAEMLQESCVTDIITGVELSLYPSNNQDIEACMVGSTAALVAYLTTTPNCSRSSASVNLDLSDSVLLREKMKEGDARIHRCTESQLHLLDDPYIDPYIYPRSSLSPGPQPYSSHPLMEWCRTYILGLYKAHPGADLSHIPDEDIKIVYTLYKRQYITLSDLQGAWKDKLPRLKQVCRHIEKSFNRDIFQPEFIIGWGHDLFLPIKVTEWCDEFSVADLGHLFEYGDNKKYWYKLRDKLSEQGRRLWDRRPEIINPLVDIQDAIIYSVLNRKPQNDLSV